MLVLNAYGPIVATAPESTDYLFVHHAIIKITHVTQIYLKQPQPQKCSLKTKFLIKVTQLKNHVLRK